MSQLAFNEDGDPIELPPAATGWRVKRMRGTRGAPGLVYGADGAPLVIPLEMDIEDLRREVRIPGKYKLEAVDDRRRPLGLEEAIVFVPSGDATADETTEETPSAKPAPAEPNAMAVVIEAMRQNSEAMKQNAEMARTIVDRFPAMLEAAAVLITAADGAGLPAREPQRKDRDEDEDDEDDDEDNSGAEPVPAPGFDLNAVIAQLVPVLLTAISKGDIKLPNLAEMLDWRRAAASATKAKAPPSGSGAKAPPSGSGAKAPKPPTAKPQASETTGTPEAAAAPEPSADAATDAKLPPLSPQAMAHFLAIQSALTPDEAALARAAAAELSPADLRAWFEQLSAMSVPAAVERVRALLNATKAEAA